MPGARGRAGPRAPRRSPSHLRLAPQQWRVGWEAGLPGGEDSETRRGCGWGLVSFCDDGPEQALPGARGGAGGSWAEAGAS